MILTLCVIKKTILSYQTNGSWLFAYKDISGGSENNEMWVHIYIGFNQWFTTYINAL